MIAGFEPGKNKLKSYHPIILRILVQTIYISFLCQMKTVKDVSAAFRKELAGLYDIREIDSLCMIAIAEIAGTSSTKIKAFPELQLPQEHLEAINQILSKLKTGEPIQYILGHTEFYGLPFKVNPSVLIPRPETEELVEWIISSAGIGHWASGNILDIGTGSGCIAITLKKHLNEAQVSAVDISAEALKTAKENAELNDVIVDFIEADILNLKSEIEIPKSEIIVSNPPYVTLYDKKQMHTNVTDFEPHSALFVPESDPLIFYKAIADFATKHLEKGGLLFFEINENYGEQIVELLKHRSFKSIELRKDMNGKDRMIKANFSGETK
jgi:release factor glutamine methyltransferase